MTKRAAFIPILVLTLFCGHDVVGAANGRAVTLAERIKGAQSVVVATATDVRPRWDINAAGDQRIISRVSLNVEETMKGTPFPSRQLDLEGGTINGVTLHVSSVPELKRGDRAVLFLDGSEPTVDIPHLKGLGILKLDTNNNVTGSSLRLSDIRAMVATSR
jgi:hypothetical protein